jgi:hypothetical protein
VDFRHLRGLRLYPFMLDVHAQQLFLGLHLMRYSDEIRFLPLFCLPTHEVLLRQEINHPIFRLFCLYRWQFLLYFVILVLPQLTS